MNVVHPDISDFYDRLLMGCPMAHAQLQAIATRARQQASRPGEPDVLAELRALHENDGAVVISGSPVTPSPRHPVTPLYYDPVIAALERAKGTATMSYPAFGAINIDARRGTGRGMGGPPMGSGRGMGGPPMGGGGPRRHPGGGHPGGGHGGGWRRHRGQVQVQAWPSNWGGYPYGYVQQAYYAAPVVYLQPIACPPGVTGPCYTVSPYPTGLVLRTY